MMQPHTLKEFAEQLRLSGDYREAEFADEILTLIDLETDVAEPYWDLCADLDHSAPVDLKGNPAKAMERLNDRSDVLAEIEKHLTNAQEMAGLEGLSKDADDVVRELLETISEAEEILDNAELATDATFLERLRELAERPAPLEYDL